MVWRYYVQSSRLCVAAHDHQEGKPTVASMRDVAEWAGVSLKTVSRVINNELSVRPVTRQRVLKAVEVLGYQPQVTARSLRRGREYTVALAYDNPNPYYIIAMINGALSVCRKSGFGLQIYPCLPATSNIQDDLLTPMQRTKAAGVILTPPMSEDIGLLRQLSDAKVPCVRVLSGTKDPADGWPCVYVDDHNAAYAITEHLIKLGHTRIGFLWGTKRHRTSHERFRGYSDALRHYRIRVEKEFVIDGDYSFDDGFRRARWLLTLPRRPTAIFGSNDEIAAGVLAAARAAGLEVPHDLSIAGFEDNPFSRQSWPPLTTARQDTVQIAEHAARMLITQFSSQEQAEISNESFSPELIVRASTAPPSRHRQKEEESNRK